MARTEKEHLSLILNCHRNKNYYNNVENGVESTMVKKRPFHNISNVSIEDARFTGTARLLRKPDYTPLPEQHNSESTSITSKKAHIIISPNIAETSSAIETPQKQIVYIMSKYFKSCDNVNSDCELDTLAYLRKLEVTLQLQPRPAWQNNKIYHDMRNSIVDWLVAVTETLKFGTETLQLAVFCLDRYCATTNAIHDYDIARTTLYLVAKYEEVQLPSLQTFAAATCTLNTQQIIDKEFYILQKLDYNLGNPTIFNFCNSYASICDIPNDVKCLAHYIGELTLVDATTYLNYRPSLIAAASIALSNYIFKRPMWSPEFQNVTTYSLRNMKDLILLLCDSHGASRQSSYHAINLKYMKQASEQVFNIAPVKLSKVEIDILSDLCE